MITPTPATEHRLTSTVLTVGLRVAGPVTTGIHPHAIGTAQQQVLARIGDVLLYLTDPRTVARIRQEWDAAHHLATTRLLGQVS